MNKVKNHSIKMTDEQYSLLKRSAADRKKTLGKYIEELCSGRKESITDPAILCRLQTIRNMLNIPHTDWNKEMKVLFDNDVEELCVLLKW